MELMNEKEAQKRIEKSWIERGLAPSSVEQTYNKFQARKSSVQEEKRAMHNQLKNTRDSLQKSIKGKFGIKLTEILTSKEQKIWS